MKLTRNLCTFLSAAVCGFLIWCFSEIITGNKEPWDGNVLVYLTVLIMTGFLCTYIFEGAPKWAYWGGYLGQALFGGIPFFGCIIFGSGYFCKGGANLWPIGAVFLLIYSLPIFIGSMLTAKIQSDANGPS